MVVDMKDVRGRKWQEAVVDYIMKSFITCVFHQNVVMVIISRRMKWSEDIER
jgi:hypothetical protein